ncbi:MAG: potassium-transporting ATPase subunit KdpA [Candidatus Thermoplasmatota archaeon]|nr:potassium-transporting ATPase subunit KdpA [Candidatus Thermoplasmatota archaeon]MCL5730872.1 potassium-transporting ATPase subunit KdpA [Candidatus Thermoplasmatota archaeon]
MNADSSGGGYFWTNFFLNNRIVSGSLIIIIYLAVASIFAYIIYPFVAKIYRGERTFLSPVSDAAIRLSEKILGPLAKKEMRFTEYFGVLLAFSFLAGIIAFIFLYYQTVIPVIAGGTRLGTSLTFNTVVSFLTNTDLQHYSSPMQLSYFSQTFVIMGLMFLSPVIAFAASMAFVRGVLTDSGNLGNFFRDFIRSLTELFIPMTFVVTVLLILSGIPETLNHSLLVQIPFTNANEVLPLGPVSSWNAIETVGTNGGGFYSANLAFPLADPNWFTNIVMFVSLTVIPLSSLLAMGRVFGNRKFGTMLFYVVMTIFIFTAFLTFFSEYAGIPALSGLGTIFTGNMAGKETGLGIAQSTILNVGSTMTSTGAVNSALIDYTPTGMLGVLTGLLLNDPLGGDGTSVMNIFMFVIFTAFLVSLMVGKLPEVLGIKLESKEIRYSTLTIISHPIMILIPLGITLLITGITAGFVNSHAQNITTVLYEFASSASNNGSEIGGFNTSSLFFNYTDGALMLLGRYLLMGLELLIAQSFAVKKARGESVNAIQLGSFNFGMMMMFVIIFMGILSFFPVLVLGPLFSFAKDFNLGVLIP